MSASRTRSYFGIYQVTDQPDHAARVADPRHDPARHPESDCRGWRRMPTSYYARRSGVGLAMSQCRRRCSAPIRASASSASAAAPCPATRARTRPGPSSRSTRRWSRSRATSFTFLRRCAPAGADRAWRRPAQPGAPAGQFDRHPRRRRLLVGRGADAPAHPRGAARSMAGRCSRTASSSFHISNRYLDLQPVVADLAAREGWTCRDPAICAGPSRRRR